MDRALVPMQFLWEIPELVIRAHVQMDRWTDATDMWPPQGDHLSSAKGIIEIGLIISK